jgi:hypothetical protein
MVSARVVLVAGGRCRRIGSTGVPIGVCRMLRGFLQNLVVCVTMIGRMGMVKGGWSHGLSSQREKAVLN